MAIAKYWNDVSSCERGPKTPQLLNSFSTSLSDVLVQLTTQVNHAAWRTKELRTKRNSRATAFRIRSPISPWQTQLLRPLSVTSPPQPTKRKVEPMCQSYWSQLANDIQAKDHEIQYQTWNKLITLQHDLFLCSLHDFMGTMIKQKKRWISPRYEARRSQLSRKPSFPVEFPP